MDDENNNNGSGDDGDSFFKEIHGSLKDPGGLFKLSVRSSLDEIRPNLQKEIKELLQKRNYRSNCLAVVFLAAISERKAVFLFSKSILINLLKEVSLNNLLARRTLSGTEFKDFCCWARKRQIFTELARGKVKGQGSIFRLQDRALRALGIDLSPDDLTYQQESALEWWEKKYSLNTSTVSKDSSEFSESTVLVNTSTNQPKRLADRALLDSVCKFSLSTHHLKIVSNISEQFKNGKILSDSQVKLLLAIAGNYELQAFKDPELEKIRSEFELTELRKIELNQYVLDVNSNNIERIVSEFAWTTSKEKTGLLMKEGFFRLTGHEAYPSIEGNVCRLHFKLHLVKNSSEGRYLRKARPSLLSSGGALDKILGSEIRKCTTPLSENFRIQNISIDQYVGLTAEKLLSYIGSHIISFTQFRN